MTRSDGRRSGRLGRCAGVLAATIALAALPLDAAAARKASPRPATGPVAKPGAVAAPNHTSKANIAATSATRDFVRAALQADLSYSDEFERAELIERMLTECRGVSYNAYELAQTSGEALRLPAPIQLMVVRVRHPYCAELLRTYAPRTGV